MGFLSSQTQLKREWVSWKTEIKKLTIMKQKDKNGNIKGREEVRRKELEDHVYIQSESHKKDQKE